MRKQGDGDRFISPPWTHPSQSEMGIRAHLSRHVRAKVISEEVKRATIEKIFSKMVQNNINNRKLI